MRTGLQAWKYAKGLYLIPLLMVVHPELALGGAWPVVLGKAAMSMVALAAFAAALEGQALKRLTVGGRMLLLAGASTAFSPSFLVGVWEPYSSSPTPLRTSENGYRTEAGSKAAVAEPRLNFQENDITRVGPDLPGGTPPTGQKSNFDLNHVAEGPRNHEVGRPGSGDDAQAAALTGPNQVQCGVLETVVDHLDVDPRVLLTDEGTSTSPPPQPKPATTIPSTAIRPAVGPCLHTRAGGPSVSTARPDRQHEAPKNLLMVEPPNTLT